MLRLRHLVDEEDGLFRARPQELPLLAYYANSMAHLLYSERHNALDARINAQ
jgi:hypothetical protein